MTVGTTKQIMTSKPGALDFALLEMPTVGNPAGVAYALTAAFAGFISDMVSTENNQTAQFSFLIDFGTATEVQIAPEISQDHGDTFGPKAAVKSTTVAGIKETCPEILSFKAADYADFMTGSVLLVRSPTYMVSETHFVRLKARAVGALDATLRAWKMGGKAI